jgi:hypothetical protein
MVEQRAGKLVAQMVFQWVVLSAARWADEMAGA